MDLTLGKGKIEKLLVCLEHFEDFFMRGFMKKLPAYKSQLQLFTRK
ncbi:hypothetical protein NST86_12265 [Bacillus sp. FSL L8-0199]|nr:hypothetical protein [Bacillus cereus]